GGSDHRIRNSVNSPVKSSQSSRTAVTCADGGPRCAHAASICRFSRLPSTTISTSPLAMLRTHPASARSLASSYAENRKPPPCTRPLTIRCNLARPVLFCAVTPVYRESPQLPSNLREQLLDGTFRILKRSDQVIEDAVELRFVQSVCASRGRLALLFFNLLFNCAFHIQPLQASRDSNPFSSSTRTPKSCAFFNFEPGSAPATTKSVLRLTDDVTRPPAAIILRSASSRVIDSSVPVSTKVLSRSAPRPSTSAGAATSRILMSRLTAFRLRGSSKYSRMLCATSLPISRTPSKSSSGAAASASILLNFN